MKKMISLFAVVTMTAVGCGGSICDRAAGFNNTVKTKVSACPTLSGIVSTSTFDKAKCETGAKSCTSDDNATINKFFDCIDKVPNCVAGQEAAFASASQACSASITSVSAACQTALAN